MKPLKQILFKILNELYIKNCLSLTPDTILEACQKATKEWLQQKQGMNISGHIWLSQEELLEELK